MPKPIQLNLVLKVLRKKGFIFISQKGSHVKFRKSNKAMRTVIVKTSKKEIPRGTFRSILLQSGIEENDFYEKK